MAIQLRPLFVSYGTPATGDATWLDQRGSWTATVGAASAYSLRSAQGSANGNPMTTPIPAMNEDRLAGALAWRQHDGAMSTHPTSGCS